MRTICLSILLLVCIAAHAAVDVSLPAPTVTKQGNETRTIQPINFANELCSYSLTYDYTVNSTKPGEATSNWWGWSQGFIPIGMTGPSQTNWYWQAFVNWSFDVENLANRPAQVRIIREGGTDGVVEFAWDTPTLKASLFFALASGSDKLLMIGQYEPKTEVKSSFVRLVCYPATFEEPRNRAVTTVLGTRTDGTINLDLSKERWVLYEDTTAGRPASGSAGLVIGTPASFSSVTLPASGYGINTTLNLKPGARSFGLGLYDFPTIPEFEKTRAYFRQGADRDAAAIGKAVAAGMAQLIPPMPIEASRMAILQAAKDKVFARGTERWQPDGTPLSFPWARRLSGGPIRASLFVPRYRAWETMELARRLDMNVRHLYFDGSSALSSPDNWPYAGTTGQAAIPHGLALERGLQIASDPQAEVIICAAVNGTAIPTAVRKAVTEQVAAGKGLLIAGPSGTTNGWGPELFKDAEVAAARQIMSGLAWEQIPGYGEDERGRVDPLVQVFRYGKGRVVVMRLKPTTYGSLVPINDASEGLEGIVDRGLVVASRAVMAAADRPAARTAISYEDGKLALSPALPQGGKAVIRVQDDLDRTVLQTTADATKLPLTLPVLPAGRTYFADVAVQDATGATIACGFTHIGDYAAPKITNLKLSPAQQAAEVLVPKVLLPEGGKLWVTAQLQPDPRELKMRMEVRDAFGRVMGRQWWPLATRMFRINFSLDISRPVTVAHVLDVWLEDASGQTVAFERQRFGIAQPYPYDDFTGLLWSYAGGDPVLQRTDRLCYDWGADMNDLCHMGGRNDAGTGGYTDAGAAREYGISARSGLRLIPYVTRIAGDSNDKYERVPCLHDPDYLTRTKQGLVRTCRQAEPYSPAAYTLGDENYLFRGQYEVCHTPASVAAFQKWLQGKYQTIAALNAAWGTNHAGFSAITKPMILPEAAQQQVSFAPWIDHKLFMNEAFADTHDQFDAAIKTVDPQAKVGYDGFLGFNWQSGYDFERLGRNLRLNQTYTVNWLQGQLASSFARPGALTGAWGNSDADKEDGWHAFPWHCLFNGDNSAWWWTSWGCDYIPFNPDITQSDFGKWFYESLNKATQGPGKLLLHAQRDEPRVAVLHSEADMMAAAVAAEQGQKTPWAGDNAYLSEETAILHGLQDLGLMTRSVTPEMVTAGLDPAKTRMLWLPFASCISDEMAAALTKYVQAGGALVVDGRAGLLTGDGKIREKRALDDLLGVTGKAGLAGWQEATAQAQVRVSEEPETVTVLEPGLKPTSGQLTDPANPTPVLIANRVGKGVALMANLPLNELNGQRTKPGRQLAEMVVVQAVSAAEVYPFAIVNGPGKQEALCLQQTNYTDGNNRYLALMQDFRVRGLQPQKLTVRLPRPVFVYDILGGKRIGTGRVQDLNLTIQRGYPSLYALLPYEVTGVTCLPRGEFAVGKTTTVTADVSVGNVKPGYHVVRLDVFAPGGTAPHRQYSQNIACPGGKGSATIPFALNDPKGTWRLRWRDVATGMKGQGQIVVK